MCVCVCVCEIAIGGIYSPIIPCYITKRSTHLAPPVYIQGRIMYSRYDCLFQGNVCCVCRD